MEMRPRGVEADRGLVCPQHRVSRTQGGGRPRADPPQRRQGKHLGAGFWPPEPGGISSLGSLLYQAPVSSSSLWLP